MSARSHAPQGPLAIFGKPVAKNRVLESSETPDGSRCVDLFVRPDGTFGFEVYRRDSEDPRGWFAIGYQAQRTFATHRTAREEAMRQEPWLRDRPAPGR